MVCGKNIYIKTTMFTLILFLSISVPIHAEMKKISDAILDKTVGSGLALSITGEIGVSFPDGSSFSFTTGSGNTAGSISLTDATISNFIIKPIVSVNSGMQEPLKIDVKTASGFSEPGMADGTGFINIDLPSIGFLTDAFSADFATDNDMSDSDIDKFVGISYNSANISLYSGNIKIFAH